MKVSYYLGAGASFGTIPIINELSLQLTHFAAELNKFEIHPEYKDQLKELSDSIFKISSRSSYFGSIDTFAQNLYFNRRNEGKISLSLIKTVISLYFSILQTEKNVHNRLIYFLTKIRKHLITSSQSLNPKIKFITWNYDFQLELALNELIFQMDDVRLLIDKLLIYPNQQSGNFINQEYQIIHLNGIAGLFDVIKSGENEIGSLFNRSNSKSREKIFWKMYFLSSYLILYI